MLCFISSHHYNSLLLLTDSSSLLRYLYGILSLWKLSSRRSSSFPPQGFLLGECFLSLKLHPLGSCFQWRSSGIWGLAPFFFLFFFLFYVYCCFSNKIMSKKWRNSVLSAEYLLGFVKSLFLFSCFPFSWG